VSQNELFSPLWFATVNHGGIGHFKPVCGRLSRLATRPWRLQPERQRLTVLANFADIRRVCPLQGLVSFLAGTNPYRLFQVLHKNLAIPYPPRNRRFGNGLDHHLDLVVRNRDFELQLGQEIDHVFSNPRTSVTVMPCTPAWPSASRTSSSLKGLMIAVIIFTVGGS
jgi:hypothetical protein